MVQLSRRRVTEIPFRACPRCGEVFLTRHDFDVATRFRGWQLVECECYEGCPECRADNGKLPQAVFRVGVWAHMGCGGEMLDEGRPMCGVMAGGGD